MQSTLLQSGTRVLRPLEGGVGRGVQRLVPDLSGGAGELLSIVALSKKGDSSTKPEWDHVQSTDLWPQSRKCTANKSFSRDSDNSAQTVLSAVE